MAQLASKAPITSGLVGKQIKSKINIFQNGLPI